jgi:hypothetical protein
MRRMVEREVFKTISSSSPINIPIFKLYSTNSIVYNVK